VSTVCRSKKVCKQKNRWTWDSVCEALRCISIRIRTHKVSHT